MSSGTEVTADWSVPEPLPHGVHLAGSGAPYLVCLHPMGLDSTVFRALESLDGTIVSVDLPGHAGVPIDGDPYLSIPHLAESVGKQILGLGLPAFSLLGASLGGMIAQRFAAENPEQVSALYLINTAATLATVQKDDLRRRIALVRTEGVQALAEHTVDRWFPAGSASRSPAAETAFTQLVRTPAETHIKALSSALTIDNSDVLPSITCPTWILTGGHDLNTTPAKSRTLGEQIPVGHTDVVDDCGHMIILEQPDIVRNLILRTRRQRTCPAFGDNRMRHIA